MQVAFSEDVIADYEEAEASFLMATSVDNASPWDFLEEAIRIAELELTDGAWEPRDKADRTRPSVDALGRRVARDRRLPRINPAVDAYNLVSLRHGLPAGAFDLDAVEGDIVIRRAGPDEPFRGIGGGSELAREGEVVYADACRLLTRGWNYRDCDHTKVTPTSRTVLFMIERVSREVPHETLERALNELGSLIANHTHVAARACLNRQNPVIELPCIAPIDT